MRRLELNRWRGQFDRPEVIRTIRRKIRGTIASERTVLVDLEGAGITQEQAAEIMVGWSDREVKFCGCIHSLPVALPAEVVASAPPQSGRNALINRRQNGRLETP